MTEDFRRHPNRSSDYACISLYSINGLPLDTRSKPFVRVHFKKQLDYDSTFIDSRVVDEMSDGIGKWKDCCICIPLGSSIVKAEIWYMLKDSEVFLGWVNIKWDHSSDSEARYPIFQPNGLKKNSSSLFLHMSCKILKEQPKEKKKEKLENRIEVVDPSFHFLPIQQSIDWIRVAEVDVHRIFRHADLATMSLFREAVQFGKLHDDDYDICINKNKEKAFIMCQLMNQYLFNCNELLSKRYIKFKARLEKLTFNNDQVEKVQKGKNRHIQCLQKEVRQLDEIIALYSSIQFMKSHRFSVEQKVVEDIKTPIGIEPKQVFFLKKTQPNPAKPNPETTKTLQNPPTCTSPLKLRPATTLESLERKAKNALEKEEMRKERILVDNFESANRSRVRQNEMGLMEEQKRIMMMEKAVRRIQRFFRWKKSKDFYQKKVKAAKVIQLNWRKILRARKFRNFLIERHKLRTLELKKRSIECKLMAQEEDRERKRLSLLPAVTILERIRQILVKAAHQGTLVSLLFRFFDAKRDFKLDRQEFRLAIKHLGIDITRYETRRLLHLIKHLLGKSSDSTLSLSYDEFIHSMDLGQFKLTAQEIRLPSTATSLTAYAPISKQLLETPVKECVKLEKNIERPLKKEQKPEISDISKLAIELRDKVLKSASYHLTKEGLSLSDWQSFKNTMKKIFESYDVNKNGTLEYQEFSSYLNDLGISLDKNQFAMLTECLDFNLDGTISMNEFIQFALLEPNKEEIGEIACNLRMTILSKLGTIQQRETNHEANIGVDGEPNFETLQTLVLGYFKEFRLAKNNVVSVVCFMKMMKMVQKDIRTSDLSALVNRLDKNCDGQISLDEFIHWLSKSRTTQGTETIDLRDKKDNLCELIGYVKTIRSAFNSCAIHVGGDKSSGLEAIFQEMDVDSSKKITIKELHSYLVEKKIVKGISKIQFENVMGCFDVDGNGVITRKEFIQFCSQSEEGLEVAILSSSFRKMILSTYNQESLYEWFCLLDKAKLGRIRVGEIRKLIHELATDISGVAVQQIIQGIDKDGNGWISYDDLAKWVFPSRDIETLDSILWKSIGLHMKERSFDTLYSVFDPERRGYVSKNNLMNGMKQFTILLNEEEANILIRKYDCHNNGCLEYSDFKDMMHQNETNCGGVDVESFGYSEEFAQSSNSIKENPTEGS